MHRLSPPAILLCCALLACSGGDSARTTANPSAGASASVANPENIPGATFAPALGIDLATFTRAEQGFYYKDVRAGTGPEAVAGSVVAVHYLGRLTTGSQFDANQPGQPPLQFQLGAAQMIPGFDWGVKGMKVGGQRMIILPPSLGYGAQGSGPVPPNAIMLFTLDLMSATQPGR